MLFKSQKHEKLKSNKTSITKNPKMKTPKIEYLREKKNENCNFIQQENLMISKKKIKPKRLIIEIVD